MLVDAVAVSTGPGSDATRRAPAERFSIRRNRRYAWLVIRGVTTEADRLTAPVDGLAASVRIFGRRCGSQSAHAGTDHADDRRNLRHRWVACNGSGLTPRLVGVHVPCR